MKKKILVLSVALVSVLGAAIGAYMLYDYNENKPLILKCTVMESPAGKAQVGSYKIVKITELYVAYWNSAEEDWEGIPVERRISFGSDKNRFSWREGDYRKNQERTEINRNSGDYSVSACYESCLSDQDFNVVYERG